MIGQCIHGIGYDVNGSALRCGRDGHTGDAVNETTQFDHTSTRINDVTKACRLRLCDAIEVNESLRQSVTLFPGCRFRIEERGAAIVAPGRPMPFLLVASIDVMVGHPF
jgi:hypothetical protein